MITTVIESTCENAHESSREATVNLRTAKEFLVQACRTVSIRRARAYLTPWEYVAGNPERFHKLDLKDHDQQTPQHESICIHQRGSDYSQAATPITKE